MRQFLVEREGSGEGSSLASVIRVVLFSSPGSPYPPPLPFALSCSFASFVPPLHALGIRVRSAIFLVDVEDSASIREYERGGEDLDLPAGC